MRKNIAFIALIVVIFGLLYYAYPIITNRYFNENTRNMIISSPLEETAKQFPENVNFMEDKLEEIKIQQNSLKKEGNILHKITTKNCSTECEGFSDEGLEYCKEVCGLNLVQKTITNCENASGIKKDYCLKDLAINRQDFNVCDKIVDENIKKSCGNRVIEEIMDNN